MLPLDLHVLGLPLAFILSQDQTLHCKKNNFSSVPTDFFSFRFASRRRNQELTNCTTLQIIIKLFTVIQRTETRRFISLFQNPVFAVRAKRDYKGMTIFSIDQNFFHILCARTCRRPLFFSIADAKVCAFLYFAKYFAKYFCVFLGALLYSAVCQINAAGKIFPAARGFSMSRGKISRLWRRGRAGGRVCR